MKPLIKFFIYLLSISTLLSIAQAGSPTVIPGPWAGWTVFHDSSPTNFYTVNAVNGSWIVENALPIGASTYASQWIGIGGEHNAQLLQIGTTSDYCVGYNPSTLLYCKNSTNFFWELAPIALIDLTGPQRADMIIKPGDKIYASISLVSNSLCSLLSPCWELYLNDTSESEAPFVKYINPSPKLGIVPVRK